MLYLSTDIILQKSEFVNYLKFKSEMAKHRHRRKNYCSQESAITSATSTVEIEKSSGNVYADLGNSDHQRVPLCLFPFPVDTRLQ